MKLSIVYLIMASIFAIATIYFFITGKGIENASIFSGVVTLQLITLSSIQGTKEVKK